MRVSKNESLQHAWSYLGEAESCLRDAAESHYVHRVEAIRDEVEELIKW